MTGIEQAAVAVNRVPLPPRHFFYTLGGNTSGVRADYLVVNDSGCLIFHSYETPDYYGQSRITLAVAPGQWKSVWEDEG